jgi:trehalose synthase
VVWSSENADREPIGDEAGTRHPQPRWIRIMIEPAPPLLRVDVTPQHTLDDYAAVAHLAGAAAELRAETARIAPRLAGRTVWIVNSTATGGGVAEMLPSIVGLLRDQGISTEWMVIGSSDPAFYALTKRLHNLIHGVGEPSLSAADREVFERVGRENAAQLQPLLRPGDVLIVHDPQPLPLAGFLRPAIPLVTVWRCHIGLDESNAATRAAWEFLAPYLQHYDHAVFSAPEYIPERLAGRAKVIYPGIDPLGPKNRDLTLHETVGVLCRGAIIPCPGPTVGGPYRDLARRALSDGTFMPVNASESIGLLSRPTITQISRWDRLKGFLPLMRAFARLKQSVYDADGSADPLQRRRLDLVRLVLAGPDPAGVSDDPEATEVLNELSAAYAGLHPAVQDDIALVVLPMRSVEENALMVNALQRASTIVVQNSLREGFGLTIAEAMWKRVPVLSNSRACGPRQQVRDGVDGRLIRDPEDETELRHAIEEMRAAADDRRRMGRSAQRRVHDSFLVLDQLRSWGQLLWVALEPRATGG